MNGDHPVSSPVIARWPIEQMVEAGYLLANKFSHTRQPDLRPLYSLFYMKRRKNEGDLGLVWEQHYILCLRLIKLKMFVQFDITVLISRNYFQY